MKRKLGRWFALSPVIIGIFRFLTSLVFRVLATVGADPTATSGLLGIIKSFINRGLGLLALISIILCIIGIVFLATSSKNIAKSFTVKEIIQFSRTAAKKNMGKFLVGFAIYIVLQIVSNTFGYAPMTVHAQRWNIIVTVLVFLFASWLILGFKNLSLHIVHQKKALFSDIFVSIQKTLKYLGAYILVTIIISIGIMLLIVPGIIFALKLSMVPYLIIDKNMGPIEAIKASRRFTKGYIGDIFVLGILCGLINIVGMLVVLVGLLRTIPLFMIANAYLYKKIIGSKKIEDKSQKLKVSKS